MFIEIFSFEKFVKKSDVKNRIRALSSCNIIEKSLKIELLLIKILSFHELYYVIASFYINAVPYP